MALKFLLLGIFSTLKVDKWPRKLNFRSKVARFGRLDGSFLAILRVKKVVFLTFSKLFRKFLSINFGLNEIVTFAESSPLGSRKAIYNIDKASSLLLVSKIDTNSIQNNGHYSLGYRQFWSFTFMANFNRMPISM